METEEHFFGKVAQKAIILQEDKILLTRDPRTPDTWELPGGRLNVGEDSKKGLKRELFEELGVDFSIQEVVHTCQFWQGTEFGNRALAIIYRAEINPDVDLKPDSKEISEWQWFSRSEIKGLKLFPEYIQALEIFFAGK